MIDRILDFFTVNMINSIFFFIAGHTFGWFAGNSQLVWEFWKDKPLLSNIIFGIPAGMLFWYGTKLCFEASGGNLWTVRFVAAVFSYAVFPFMTWYYLQESMFNTKTMICVALAVSILLVQIYFE